MDVDLENIETSPDRHDEFVVKGRLDKIKTWAPGYTLCRMIVMESYDEKKFKVGETIKVKFPGWVADSSEGNIIDYYTDDGGNPQIYDTDLHRWYKSA